MEYEDILERSGGEAVGVGGEVGVCPTWVRGSCVTRCQRSEPSHRESDALGDSWEFLMSHSPKEAETSEHTKSLYTNSTL